MNESCPVLTPNERQVVEILERNENTMLTAVLEAIHAAKDASDEELQAVQFEGHLPPYNYFASVIHHKLFLLLCGADLQTMLGGDPAIGAAILENGRKISARYWKTSTSDQLAPDPAS